MKDLKKININVFGNFREYETIQISVDGVPAEYTPSEILGVISKLADLQKVLTDNLIMDRMNQIDKEGKK